MRRLHRTSLPIPHAGGTSTSEAVDSDSGGLLTFESEWSPALGPSMDKALNANLTEGVWTSDALPPTGTFSMTKPAARTATPTKTSRRPRFFSS